MKENIDESALQRIPIEIWVEIIHHALYDPFIFDPFSPYQALYRLRGGTAWDRRTQLFRERRRKLSRVSSSWNRIVCGAYGIYERSGSDASVGHGAIALGVPRGGANVAILRRCIIHEDITINFPFYLGTLRCLNIAGTGARSRLNAEETLKAISVYRSLQSLAISWIIVESFGLCFLHAYAELFPHLVSLRLYRVVGKHSSYEPFCNSIPEITRLSNLVCLDISVDRGGCPDISSWELPSLRHFAIGAYTQTSPEDISSVLETCLKNFGAQLETLVLEHTAHFPPSFWPYVPQLRTLYPVTHNNGAPLHVQPPPPDYHPAALEIVHIAVDCPGWEGCELERWLLDNQERGIVIRSLIPWSMGDNPRPEDSRHMQAAGDRFKRLGLRFEDVNGMSMAQWKRHDHSSLVQRPFSVLPKNARPTLGFLQPLAPLTTEHKFGDEDLSEI